MNNDNIFNHYLNKIMVTMPVEIVEVDSDTNLCTVKPLIFNELEFPLIVKCPFLPIGSKDKNIKFKVQVGHRYMALFSQLDLSNYISSGNSGQVNSKKTFSFTNCVILPILAMTEVDGIKVPELDFEINGNIKIKGNIDLEGDITQKGNITQTGGITSTDDVVSGGISLQKHNHLYNPGPGSPTPTGKPQ